jgi:hypothetical protein
MEHLKTLLELNGTLSKNGSEIAVTGDELIKAIGGASSTMPFNVFCSETPPLGEIDPKDLEAGRGVMVDKSKSKSKSKSCKL